MTSLHTPGPWKAIDGKIHSESYCGRAPIAKIYASPLFSDGNANLIEAAPDLLLATQYLMTIISRNAPNLEGMMEFDFARAAVAKAVPS